MRRRTKRRQESLNTFAIRPMEPFGQIGKFLILAGLLIVVIGAVMVLIGRVPFVGKLPGDIVVQRRNFTFYFPLGTSILLSIIISLIFWLLSRK